jgi:hypothetical protein
MEDWLREGRPGCASKATPYVTSEAPYAGPVSEHFDVFWPGEPFDEAGHVVGTPIAKGLSRVTCLEHSSRGVPGLWPSLVTRTSSNNRSDPKMG